MNRLNELTAFLSSSYTAYQAAENARNYLLEHGFLPLSEQSPWTLKRGGKYFVVRGGSAFIAFTIGGGESFRIAAAHTDSPCLKLKENPVMKTENYFKLNVETYGGGIWYTFFDRPLKLAGRLVRERNGVLVAENYVSDYDLVIPSLAVHVQRDVNEKFAPNPQIDLLPLLGTTERDFLESLGGPLSYDLYLAVAQKPFACGMNGELLSSPRLDNLTGVFAAVEALAESEPGDGICMAACFDSEEIGSRTLNGAGGDFLKAVMTRIGEALSLTGEALLRAQANSFLLSVDNAHAVHPDRPEKCDPTNRPVLGGGVVVKGHAGGAYTTDALTSAVVKKIFSESGVRFQTFYNRSDARSGSTLGAISLGQVSVRSADVGLAQLAMHSAVETFAGSDYPELVKGLSAFFATSLSFREDGVSLS